MIEIAISGRGTYTINNLILDLNGTIAVDGKIIGGVREKLAILSQKLDVIITTADTNKNAERLIKNLPAALHKIKEGEEDEQKLELVLKKGKSNTISIGNGCNDISMLKESAIGICIIGGEGASTEAIMASDLAVSDINDALALLLKPHRLKATLRR